MISSSKKVVLDTNIFIKGWFGEDEVCQKIMNLIDKRKMYLSFGQDTIGELIYLTKNFARRFIVDRNNQVGIVQDVAKLFYYASSVNTLDTISEKTKDEFDDMFMKCATEGKVDYLVTDDFKSGMHDIESLPFTVLSSREFMKLYE